MSVNRSRCDCRSRRLRLVQNPLPPNKCRLPKRDGRRSLHGRMLLWCLRGVLHGSPRPTRNHPHGLLYLRRRWNHSNRRCCDRDALHRSVDRRPRRRFPHDDHPNLPGMLLIAESGRECWLTRWWLGRVGASQHQRQDHQSAAVVQRSWADFRHMDWCTSLRDAPSRLEAFVLTSDAVRLLLDLGGNWQQPRMANPARHPDHPGRLLGRLDHVLP